MIVKLFHLAALLLLIVSSQAFAVADLENRVMDPKVIFEVRTNDSVNSAQFSPDGKYIVTSSDDGFARIIDATTGNLLRKIPHFSKVNSAQFSPDGKYIITGSDDGFALIIDATTGKIQRSIQNRWQGWYRDHITDKIQYRIEDKGPVASAEFSPDGKLVVIGYKNGYVKILDVASQQTFPEIEYDLVPVKAKFSSDGKLIVTANYNSASIIDVSTGKILRHLKFIGVSSVQFSPDNKLIVISSYDGFARIIEVATGQTLHEIKHVRPVETVQFSLDGKLIVTASQSFYARVILVSTGQILQDIKTDELVFSAQFSPDGKFIVTGAGPYEQVSVIQLYQDGVQ